MTTASTQAATAAQPLPFGSPDEPKTAKKLRDRVAEVAGAAVSAVTAALSQATHGGRPVVTTRAGQVYADGAAWDLYTELAHVHDFIKGLSRDLEHGDLSAAQVITVIDEFTATLPAQYQWVDTETLSHIRRAKQGDSAVLMGPKLSRLRGIADHFESAVAAAVQDLQRPLSPLAVAPAETDLPPWEHRSKIQLINGRRPN